jgi:hypothetical protein
MKAEWERKYRAALTEHNPSLKWRRIQEAHKAIMLRIRETEETSDEREKLENAIELLNLLRNRR